MSRISNYAENALGNHTFRNTAFTTPGTSIYFSLHTGDPGDTGANEASGGSYARKQFTSLAAPSGRSIVSSANLGFDTLTAGIGTATNLGIWDALTGGNFLWHSASFSLPLSVGVAPTFEAGNITISVGDNISTYLAQKWLNHTFRNTAFTTPGTAIWVSLHTSDPGLTGAGEISGNNYAREQFTNWTAFSNGISRNAAQIQFNTPSGNWGSVVGFGIWDASSSGNFLVGGSIASAYEALASDSGILSDVNDIVLTIS